MTDLFISYSRRDLHFVQRLYESLKERSRDVWIDLEDIPPTAQWLAEIYAGIEATNAFVFVISPDSAVSEVCRLEIEYAVKHGKKLVPLLHREVADPTLLHPALASHNWLFFREQDDFNRAFTLLNDALDTDLDHVRTHTRLLVRALEWDNRQRDRSYLLRGTDLSEAEVWLSENSDKDPEPTATQTQYILASRQAETHRQRTLLVAVTAAFVISLALAVIAFVQWREADAARLKAAQAEGTAVAALISVNDTRGTAQAQEDTFRATIRALGQQAQFELEAAEEPGEEIFVETQQFLTPAADADVALTATAIAEALYPTASPSPTLSVQQVAPTLIITTLPDTGGGPDIETGLRLSAAQVKLAATADEQRRALDELLWLLQHSDYPLRRTLTGHNGPVQAIAYSPDGRILVSGSDDNTVIAWDTATWARVGLPYYGHESSVTDVAYSPDGRLIASSSRDGRIGLWNVDDASVSRWLMTRDNAWVLSVTFTPDGSGLISTGSTPLVRRWDVASGSVTQEYHGLSGTAYSAVVSPDGRYIAAADSTGLIIVWDAADGSELKRLAAHEGAVLTLAFSPDGRTLASGGADNLTMLWDVDSGELLHVLADPANVVLNLAFSPDGLLLAAGTAENLVHLWDVASGAPVGGAFGGYADWVYSVAFSPDGRTLASGSSDGTIVLWPAGADAWIDAACTLAGELSEQEWADFFPRQPYQDICPG